LIVILSQALFAWRRIWASRAIRRGVCDAIIARLARFLVKLRHHLAREGMASAMPPRRSKNVRASAPEETIMLEGLFQPTHLLMIAGIALLVLGPRKLPELGKGLGESIRGFKAAMQGKEDAPASQPTTSTNEKA
jgi:sec-independent protein translocase protein TatA